MRYIKHDYPMNFMSATGSEDTVLSQEILLDEVAQLIVRHPIEIIDALRESGVKIKGKPSDTEIVNVLTKNLGENEMLSRKVSKLIIRKNNGNVRKDKFHNATDPYTEYTKSLAEGNKKGKSDVDWAKTAAVGADLLGTLFGGLKAKQEAKSERARIERIKAERAAAKQRDISRQILLAKIAAIKGKGKKKGIGTFAIVGITIGVLVILGIMYQSKKNK